MFLRALLAQDVVELIAIGFCDDGEEIVEQPEDGERLFWGSVVRDEEGQATPAA
ncbi:hypothetical protein [Bradyrhizobium yuanmingense]|uniref:hypothetical protein n=1 Tax=Bradyrhizobium yuanmingense TaxID=108015 RepID=UPI0012E3F446|nr:hypothetical protein [Bradyrhizobium yuanmingense]